MTAGYDERSEGGDAEAPPSSPRPIHRSRRPTLRPGGPTPPPTSIAAPSFQPTAAKRATRPSLSLGPLPQIEVGDEIFGSDARDDLTERLPNDTTRRPLNMATVNESMDKAMAIEGAFAVALVDYESGMTLGTRSTTNAFDIEVAASGNTQVVRAKMQVMEQLNIGGGIDDILITLDTQYHLLRPLSSATNLFLYLAIDRKRGNLGMARHQLAAIDRELAL